MAAKNLSDLLPVGDNPTAAHAYQVFGLEPGEQDLTKVAGAVQTTVKRLRDVKSETDPVLWQKAAQLVHTARVTLADPARKSELDARFGIVTFADDERDTQPSPPSKSIAKSDPLAGMLPPSNPLAPASPQPTVPTPTSTSTPTPTPTPTPTSTPTSTSTTTTPVIRKSRPVKTRRRRPIFGSLMMATFMLGLLVLIASLVYFLLYGPGTLAISSKDGELKIITGPPPTSPERTVAGPRPITNDKVPAPRRRFDPVMGELAGDVEPPAMPDEVPAREEMTEPEQAIATASSDPRMVDQVPAIEQIPTNVTTQEANATVVGNEGVSDEMAAEADAAIARVSDLIRAANWKEMRMAAENLIEMPMKPEQQPIANGLYQVADLATFYQVGIVKGIAKTDTAEEIEVTEGVRISIVEKGEQSLVIRVNGRNRSYPIAELPFSLTDKFASLAIDQGSTLEASQAVYQAIAPNSNEGYRDEAIEVLDRLRDQVAGADSDLVIDSIKRLFTMGT